MKLIPFVTKELEKVFSKSTMLVKLYSAFYKNIVKKEVKLAKINNNDSIIFIGGGSIPCTALQIASMTGANVKIIDVDPVAVERANKIISKLNLSHSVKVQLTSGQNINAHDFSVIHIARQAMPHDEIIENITKKLSRDARILLRSNLSCFEKLNKIHVNNCKCIYIRQIKQGLLGLKSTFMLTIKKNRSSESEIKKGNSYTDGFKPNVASNMVS